MVRLSSSGSKSNCTCRKSLTWRSVRTAWGVNGPSRTCIKTSGGSVASDAEKLAKPILPDRSKCMQYVPEATHSAAAPAPIPEPLPVIQGSKLAVQSPLHMLREAPPVSPIFPPDVTGLAEEVCLTCMPGFRAGDALGGPGQPSVNFIGKKPNLGAHAP
eukprot:1160631-Pelagomonas_calceolata.AAC.8